MKKTKNDNRKVVDVKRKNGKIVIHSQKKKTQHATVKHNEKFENLCKLTQLQMKTHLSIELVNAYGEENVVIDDGYVFARGTEPVLLVAHMDTVHKSVPRRFVYTKKSTIISSPQGIGGDDRCGIYMILEIIKECKCSVVFTEDEEKGCIGADTFATDIMSGKVLVPNVNYIIELDRRGTTDAVYYDLDNLEFEHFITKASGEYFKTKYGSCSDIFDIAPALDVAAVNLSSCYMNEHTKDEYVMLSEIDKHVELVKKIIQTPVEKPFEWKEFYYSKGWMHGAYRNLGCYTHGFEDQENDFYSSFHTYEIAYENENKDEVSVIIEAYDDIAAIGEFLMNHPTLCYNDIYSVYDVTDYV